MSFTRVIIAVSSLTVTQCQRPNWKWNCPLQCTIILVSIVNTLTISLFQAGTGVERGRRCFVRWDILESSPWFCRLWSMTSFFTQVWSGSWAMTHTNSTRDQMPGCWFALGGGLVRRDRAGYFCCWKNSLSPREGGLIQEAKLRLLASSAMDLESQMVFKAIYIIVS